MVDAMTKMDAMPAKKQAAETMKQLLDFYKPTAKMALRDETTQIQQWHQAFEQSIVQESAAQELGLTQIIAQMITKDTEVETLMGERDEESAQKADVQLAADRKAKKTGGLCIALKGAPFSPADEVDAEKEYGLVSYSE